MEQISQPQQEKTWSISSSILFLWCFFSGFLGLPFSGLAFMCNLGKAKSYLQQLLLSCGARWHLRPIEASEIQTWSGLKSHMHRWKLGHMFELMEFADPYPAAFARASPHDYSRRHPNSIRHHATANWTDLFETTWHLRDIPSELLNTNPSISIIYHQHFTTQLIPPQHQGTLKYPQQATELWNLRSTVSTLDGRQL